MAKNLYNLTAVTTVNDSDLLHVNQGSVSSDKKVTKQNLLKEVNSSISSINNSLTQRYSHGTWTPKLYDYETYKRDLPTATYFRTGDLVVYFGMYNANACDLSGISTMLQIRNFPISGYIIGGGIYIGAIAGSGGSVGVQATYDTAYFRPNITGTTSTPGVVTFWLLQYAPLS